MKTNNQRLLEEQAKTMSTIDILNRLKEVKRIRDKADEEFYYLGVELWNRIPSINEVKKQKDQSPRIMYMSERDAQILLEDIEREEEYQKRK